MRRHRPPPGRVESASARKKKGTSSGGSSHPASAAARCVSPRAPSLSLRSRPSETQARYVHQDCLRSWREADKLNSFYACGQCGERYRFRKTRVTALLGSRRALLPSRLVAWTDRAHDLYAQEPLRSSRLSCSS